MQLVREVCTFWRVFWRPGQNASVTIAPCNLCERCTCFGALFWRPLPKRERDYRPMQFVRALLCVLVMFWRPWFGDPYQNASVIIAPCNLCVRCYRFWEYFGGPALATLPKHERNYRPMQFVRALL